MPVTEAVILASAYLYNVCGHEEVSHKMEKVCNCKAKEESICLIACYYK